MKSSTALCTPLFVHVRRTATTATRMTVVTGRDRVPPTRVPGGTLRQPNHRQKKAFDHPVGTQGFHRVLATGRHEPAGRHPQGRHIRPVELDEENESAGRQRTDRLPRGRGRGGGLGRVGARLVECAFHAEVLTGARRSNRRRPARSCFSRSRLLAVAAPGRARITTSVPRGTTSTRSMQI